MDDDDLDFLDEFIDKAFEEAEKNEKATANVEKASTLATNKSKQLKDFNFLAEETQETDISTVKKSTSNAEGTKNQGQTSEIKKPVVEKSLIHKGDTDDSEDEDNRNPTEKKYNEFGQFINSKLKEEENGKRESLSSLFKNKSWKSKTRPVVEKEISKTPKSVKTSGDSFVSTIGLNIVNPLVTAGLLFEKMAGRSYVHFVKLKYHTERIARKDSEVLNKDWIVIGVIVGKSAAKESKKGNNFCVWTISDLRMGLKSASLFLFGKAYTELWKRPVGTVIGVLNPTVMEQSQRDNVEACLSVFSADQVMIIGQSKDFGLCKARKKNGDNCTMFVNKSSCEFCIYHVEKEYKKFSNHRSDLQSPTSGGLQKLRNKVLGKNEVFYAGQSFTSVKSKQSKKAIEKDKSRLRDLFGACGGGPAKCDVIGASDATNAKPSIEFTRFKKIKDAELLAKLSDDKASEKKASDYRTKETDKTDKPSKLKTSSPKNKENSGGKAKPKVFSKESLLSKTLDECDTNLSVKAKSVLESRRKIMEAEKELEDKRKALEAGIEFSRESLSEFFSSKKVSLDKLSSNRSPVVNGKMKQAVLKRSEKSLSCSAGPVMVDLSVPITRRDRERAKLTALNYVKNKGPIKKMDPNEIRNKTAPPKKRSFPDDTDDQAAESEKSGSGQLPARFIELMNKTSKHTDLLERADQEAFNNYFDKMSKKEEMEEKMLNTFKLPCKAVRCLNCKYTWFSASELCKAEGHRLKVVDATKRFFRCGHCSQRTVTLDLVPLLNCHGCGHAAWLRAAMISEKKTMVNLNQLSIRGGEQKFINAVECNGNLNLLVPE